MKSSTLALAIAALVLVTALSSQAAVPTLELPNSLTLLHGAPLHLPLNGFDADGDDLTFSVTVSDPTFIETLIPVGNRSLKLDVANYGTMMIELFEQRAPRTTARIIELAESNFYDGVTFHRVIDNFVIQGGDPTGTGAGGSNLPDFDDEFHPDLMHSAPGVLSMAKAGDDTNNSQFFITDVRTEWLDFNHSVFGQVTDGDDVRQSISGATTGTANRPTSEIVIESARIINDTENGVLMLKAIQSSTDLFQIDVTVSDGVDSVTKAIEIAIADDQTNHMPFMTDIPALQLVENGTLVYQLTGTDVEGDDIAFRAISRQPGATVSVDETGLLTIVPPVDFRGELEIVAIAYSAGSNPTSTNSDLQSFFVTVVPEPSAATLFWFSILTTLGLRRRRNNRCDLTDLHLGR